MSTFVRDNAVRVPDAIALEDADTGDTITWAALDARVDAFARVLTTELGLGPGDRVAYFAADTPDTFVVMLAGMRVGAVFVPLNRRLSGPELETLCKDAEPAILIHDDEWAGRAGELCAAVGVRSALLSTLVETAAGHPASSGWAPQFAFGPLDPVMLLYTSGTTGLPKGALVTEGMLTAHLVNVLDSMGAAQPGVKYLSALPLFHAAGLLAIAMPVLLRGGTISVVRAFDPVRLATLLADPSTGFTHFNGAPIMWQLIAEAAGAEASFAHLRHGMVGGGQLPTHVDTYFAERGLELQVGWGATEMGPSTTIMPVGRAGAVEGSVGRMVQLTRLRVVKEDGTDAAPGEVGEAWLNGPNISPGYWRIPLADDQTRTGGWYRCGDAVSVTPDGHVVFRGRFKDMYKSGGENVFAAEVERVLLEFRGVAEACVIGVPHHRWGEAGRALIVPDAGAEVDVAALLAHCRTRLAGYKVPADVVTCHELPRNVTGKVQKLDLLRDFGTPITA